MIRLPRALRPVGDPVPIPRIRDAIGLDASSADARGSLAELIRFDGYRSQLYGSGTAALAAAVRAAVEERAAKNPEVLIPAYACPDIVSAVVFAGATPILVDNLPELPWMDPSCARRALTPRTVAVVHMRFLGLPGNGGALREAMGEDGPLLIEDSAHWFPSGSRIECASDFIAFSFGRGKPVSVRRGGLLLERKARGGSHRPPAAHSLAHSTSAALAHLFGCALYNVAVQPTVYWFVTRIARAPVDAIAWRKLKRLSAFPPSLARVLTRAIRAHRSRSNALQERLRTALRSIGGPWIDVSDLPSRSHSTTSLSGRDNDRLWRYPLLIDSEGERDRLFRELWRAGLGASCMYRSPLGEMPQVRPRVRTGLTPRARDFASRLLALPLHSGVQHDDAEKLIGLLQSFAGADARAPAVRRATSSVGA